MPEVSVVVPLHNKQDTVVRAIESVLAQRFSDWELLIIDDGSTDASVSAARSIEHERFRLLHQSNCGPGAARNRGASETRGAFLAFLDADDEWLPDFLSRAMSALEEQPECSTYVAAFDTGGHRKLQEHVLLALAIESGPWRLDCAIRPEQFKRYIDACHSSCCVIRRAAFDRFGGYYGARGCRYGEDSYLWLQVLLGGQVYWDRSPTVIFHVEDSALGAKLRNQQPMRPALFDPEPLRRSCPAGYEVALEDLLALYRLIETEKLSRAGAWRHIRDLRRSFPWIRRPAGKLALRERKVEIRTAVSTLSRPFR